MITNQRRRLLLERLLSSSCESCTARAYATATGAAVTHAPGCTRLRYLPADRRRGRVEVWHLPHAAPKQVHA